jgi:hypothetical protein
MLRQNEMQKQIYLDLIGLGDDFDLTTKVPHRPADAKLGCQQRNEWTESDTLNTSSDQKASPRGVGGCPDLGRLRIRG